MIDSESVLAVANDLKTAGTPFALVTVVRCQPPTSAKPGAKAVVLQDGSIQGWIGGGCAQPAVIKVAKKAIQDGQSRLIRISPGQEEVEEGIIDFGMACHSGGTLDIFVDPITKPPVLLVLGRSPVARTLTDFASRVGFYVVAAFPGVDEELFPRANHVIDGLEWDPSLGAAPGFVVVATQGQRDEQSLESALSTGARYITFVASQRKWDKLRTYLKERGHDEDHVDAIVAPAGIEIGATTPEEIALSVVADVVKTRRTELGEVTDTSSSKDVAEPDSEGEVTNQSIDPVCGMNVDPQTAEHQSEYMDKVYYFCCASCLHSFEKDPKSYLAGVKQAG